MFIKREWFSVISTILLLSLVLASNAAAAPPDHVTTRDVLRPKPAAVRVDNLLGYSFISGAAVENYKRVTGLDITVRLLPGSKVESGDLMRLNYSKGRDELFFIEGAPKRDGTVMEFVCSAERPDNPADTHLDAGVSVSCKLRAKP